MSYSRGLPAKTGICALLLVLGACGRKTPAAPERYAILRFENLSPDLSADWMGRAFSEIVAAELPSSLVVASTRLHGVVRTLGVRPVSAPGISTERSGALLSGANRIAFGDYTIRNGRVDARLTVEDLTGGPDRVLSASAADVVSAADQLARQISPQAKAFDSRNPEAVHDYFAALEAGDAAISSQRAAAAIAADPNFALPYLLLADIRIQQQDRDGALAVLDQALARGGAMPPADRARIQFQAATLRNDFAGRQRALAEIVQANPADADSWRALGDTAFARHDYKQAVEAYQRALQSQPNDPTALNELGYSFAFSGDIDNALRTMQQYRSVRPNDANPLDSAGDINLMYGRLREAEELYRQADKKDRNVLAGGDLLKAAFARLMTGDVAGASGLAKEYADARTAMNDPAAAVIPAEWQWISGDRKGAMARLQTFAGGANPATDRDALSRACYDLAFWNLLEGDRTTAKQWSAKSGATATQSTGLLAVISQFLAQPPASPAEWSARAGQLFRNAPQNETRGLTLAYALLLDRHFDAAADTLRTVYDGPSLDPGVPVLLAWSLMETGHTQEAAPLLRLNPIPAPSGINPDTYFYFPRLFDLRARLAEKSGRSEEAAANRALYQKLRGQAAQPVP